MRSDAEKREPIRWIYPIVGGIIAEALTIAFSALARGDDRPRRTGAPRRADRPGRLSGSARLIGATLGSLLCFLLGWWAARRADGRFEAHGLLTGAAAGSLTDARGRFRPAAARPPTTSSRS